MKKYGFESSYQQCRNSLLKGSQNGHFILSVFALLRIENHQLDPFQIINTQDGRLDVQRLNASYAAYVSPTKAKRAAKAKKTAEIKQFKRQQKDEFANPLDTWKDSGLTAKDIVRVKIAGELQVINHPEGNVFFVVGAESNASHPFPEMLWLARRAGATPEQIIKVYGSKHSVGEILDAIVES
jgi:predicted RNA-binding protein YlxR (DUF448 family)